MSNTELAVFLIMLQFGGCAFYFSAIKRAQTKAQIVKITLLSVLPTFILLSIAARPL